MLYVLQVSVVFGPKACDSRSFGEKPSPSLWPPNHSYHTFTTANFISSVSDNCDSLSVNDVYITMVTSDEAENARRLHDRNGSWPAAGDPAQNPEYYAHVSPRNYFAAGQPPALLIQGTADHTIPSAHTQATYDALVASGVDAQLKWIPGGDHDLVGSDLGAAVAAEESWIRRALGV